MAITHHVWKLLRPEISGSVLTLGRQHWCTPGDTLESRGFCEPHLLKAGATSVHSMDVSPQEGASLVHDLNQPVNPSLHHAYNHIFDGGTLEHVFNVATALESVRTMIKLGGTFASCQIGNLSGHGFWSISPEALISWALANGFSNLRCLASRIGPAARWRELPVHGQNRLEISTILPFYYFFRATKTREISATPAQCGPTLMPAFPFWSHHVRLWRYPTTTSRQS